MKIKDFKWRVLSIVLLLACLCFISFGINGKRIGLADHDFNNSIWCRKYKAISSPSFLFKGIFVINSSEYKDVFFLSRIRGVIYSLTTVKRKTRKQGSFCSSFGWRRFFELACHSRIWPDVMLNKMSDLIGWSLSEISNFNSRHVSIFFNHSDSRGRNTYISSHLSLSGIFRESKGFIENNGLNYESYELQSPDENQQPCEPSKKNLIFGFFLIVVSSIPAAWGVYLIYDKRWLIGGLLFIVGSCGAFGALTYVGFGTFIFWRAEWRALTGGNPYCSYQKQDYGYENRAQIVSFHRDGHYILNKWQEMNISGGAVR